MKPLNITKRYKVLANQVISVICLCLWIFTINNIIGIIYILILELIFLAYGISLLTLWYHCADDHCYFNEYYLNYLIITERLFFHDYKTFVKKIHLNSRNKQVFERIIVSCGMFFFIRKWQKQGIFHYTFLFIILESFFTFSTFDWFVTFPIGSVLHVQN